MKITIIKTEAREDSTPRMDVRKNLDSVLGTQQGLLTGRTRFSPCPSGLPKRTANKP